MNVDKWAAEQDLKQLLRPGLQASWFNDDALGRHQDRLYEADIHQVYSTFQLHVYQHERIPMGVFHGDTTSMSVYGAYTNPFKMLNMVEGYSRDRRGAKQIQFGLIGNADGIPLYGDVYRDDITEHLHCPYCGSSSIERYGTVGTEDRYRIDEEKRYNRILKQFADKIEGFRKHLEDYPSLALDHAMELLFAFSQQIRLYDQGLACPKLLSQNESVLLESDNGELFMVMEYCQGKLIPPGRTNVHQIYDLGRTTGRMHRILNDGTLGIKNSPQFIPPSREERLAHWNSVREKTKEVGKPQLLADIETQFKASEEMDIEILDLLQTGWAHRDLWVDNLLFNDNGLTAILDFDRLKYDYPQLDVARAVISCALDDNLDVSLASAFMEGYSEERNVVEGYLTNSLQLLWYMESTWWINANMDQHSVPPARFAKEMIWLAESQKNMSALLGHI